MSQTNLHASTSLEKHIKRLEDKIKAFHRQLDEADSNETDGGESSDAEDLDLSAKMKALLKRQAEKQAIQKKLSECGAKLVRKDRAKINRRQHQLYPAGAANCGSLSRSHPSWSESELTRKIHRWEHVDALDRHLQRMKQHPESMRKRALVENPFGMLKRWAEMDHFLLRGLEKCSGEFSLMSLSCNFK